MDLYKMPTHLRNFYYNKLVDAKKKENEQVETANKASKVRIKRYFPLNPNFFVYKIFIDNNLNKTNIYGKEIQNIKK